MTKEDVLKAIKTHVYQPGNIHYMPDYVRTGYFAGMDFPAIRAWLVENGLPRTLCIESVTTEICIITPEGVMMQIRPIDNNQLGLWGGSTEAGETPVEGAVRELREETGLIVDPKDLTFVCMGSRGVHTYGDGCQGLSASYRYKLVLDYVPELKLDHESSGIKFITKKDELGEVLVHQREYISQFLG